MLFSYFLIKKKLIKNFFLVRIITYSPPLLSNLHNLRWSIFCHILSAYLHTYTYTVQYLYICKREHPSPHLPTHAQSEYYTLSLCILSTIITSYHCTGNTYCSIYSLSQYTQRAERAESTQYIISYYIL